MTNSGSRPPSRIQQVSAIPYRSRDGTIEFCLITSIKKRRWGFPKGIIDPGETMVQTALKEAYEEAGLHGHLVGEPFGTYEYSKWGTSLVVTVVLMKVIRCDDDWQESDVRQRRWATHDDALESISRKELRQFLVAAQRRIGESVRR